MAPPFRKWLSTVALWFLASGISNSYCQFSYLSQFQKSQSTKSQTENSFSDTCVHDVSTRIPFDDKNEYVHCFQQTVKSGSSRHPDQDLRVNEIIVKYGFYLQTYNNVTTKDGYILTVFRISGSPTSPPARGKPAVLLYHGMATASDIWVLQNDVNKNLAMKLANLGYDVWLVNSRGTDFSRRHVTLDAKDIKYWDFSYHEMGMYDFPTVVEFILSETGNEKILHVCHSMGCAVYGIAVAELPYLNDKIEASVLLAPAMFIGHTYVPMRLLTVLLEIGPNMQRMINLALGGRVENRAPLTNLLQSRICTPSALRCGLCGVTFFLFYGYDAPQMNYTNIPNVISKLSNAQSFKTLLHLGQNFKSCKFRKYDYGKDENFRIYRQLEPPSYNLFNMRVPTHIYYSDADNFVPPVDVIAAREALPSEIVKSFKRVQWKLFNHIDFMMAENADILVYNDVISVLNNYTNLGKVKQ